MVQIGDFAEMGKVSVATLRLFESSRSEKRAAGSSEVVWSAVLDAIRTFLAA